MFVLDENSNNNHSTETYPTNMLNLNMTEQQINIMQPSYQPQNLLESGMKQPINMDISAQQQILALQQQNQLLLMQNQMQQNQVTPQILHLRKPVVENKAQKYIDGGQQWIKRNYKLKYNMYVNRQELVDQAKYIIEKSNFQVKGVHFKNQCFSLCGNNIQIIEKQVIEKLKKENYDVNNNDEIIRESDVVKCVYGILPKIKGVLNSSLISSSILTIVAIFSFIFRNEALDTADNSTIDQSCSDPEYCEIQDVEKTAKLVKLLILIQTIVILICFLGHLFTYIINNPFFTRIINCLYFLNWILTIVVFIFSVTIAFDLEGNSFFMWNMLSFMFIQIFCIMLPIYNSRLKLQMNKLYVIIGEQIPDILLN